jgi:uncharacterized protein YjbJ (UPF0337 family)
MISVGTRRLNAAANMRKTFWYMRCSYDGRKERRHTMNWDQAKGNWKQLKGKVKEKWGQLTDDELDQIEGKRDQLVGKIQKQYGISKEEAERQVKSWETQQGA